MPFIWPPLKWNLWAFSDMWVPVSVREENITWKQAIDDPWMLKAEMPYIMPVGKVTMLDIMR